MRWITLFAIFVQTLGAQSGSQISGWVRDPSGGAVPEASISAINLNSGVRRVAVAGPDGFYAISSLSEGEYKVTVRRQGFRTMARLGVELSRGDALRLDFNLQIGGMQEFITVEGGTSSVNTEDATSGIVVDGDTARRLPLNGRSLGALITFAPGVLATPATLGEAGQFSVSGQRIGER